MDEARTIQMVVEEHFDPGTRVELLLGLPRPLVGDELDRIAAYLRQHGATDAHVSFGAVSDAEWPNAIRAEFTRQARNPQAQFLPFVVLLIGAMGAVGITAFLGFKVGQVIEQLGRNLVPLAVLGVGAFLLYTFIRSRAPERA